ncbi:MAG: hypothetical protein QOF36_2575 [Microbacteriaceae bacterium]|jgi:hypothetical protein|nr:hypothetical protein [Microbacteriaceae bacterium]
MNEAQQAVLGRIAGGAETLILLTEGRLLEAQEALDAGKFGTALTRLDEARAKLAPLVSAAHSMNFEEGTRIIRARHLQEGMVMLNLGKVEDVQVETEDHGHEEPCVNVTIKVESADRPQSLSGDQEVLIRVEG